MSKRIQVIIDDDHFDQLDKHAQSSGLSLSTLARWILVNWLRGKPNKGTDTQKDGEKTYGP